MDVTRLVVTKERRILLNCLSGDEPDTRDNPQIIIEGSTNERLRGCAVMRLLGVVVVGKRKNVYFGFWVEPSLSGVSR